MADKTSKSKQTEKPTDEGRIKSTGGQQFEGERIGMDDVLGEDIKVVNFAILPSNFLSEKGEHKDYVQIQIWHEGKMRVLMSGSASIVNALRATNKESLPLLTKVERVKTKAGRQTYNLS